MQPTARRSLRRGRLTAWSRGFACAALALALAAGLTPLRPSGATPWSDPPEEGNRPICPEGQICPAEPLPVAAEGLPLPLPSGDFIPLPSRDMREAWASFRDPLPPSPVWNPPGRKRVGLQVGHWFNEELPAELVRLGPGTSGGGLAEWEANLAIARHVQAYLENAGVEVDLLGSVLPVRYRAHAFVAIHADGDLTGWLTGFKVARPGFSSIPATDDQLVQTLNEEYATATGLARQDQQVSRRMLYYYAFNTRRYRHAIDLGVPSAIIETGFLTSAADRQLIVGQPDLAGLGIARGILRFLGLPP